MRLSPDETAPAVEKAVQAWDPIAFDGGDAGQPALMLEETLAIFQPVQTLDAPAAPKNGHGVGKMGWADWTPEEISWAPPFKTEAWNNWDGAVKPGLHASMAQMKVEHETEEALGVLAKARARAEELLFEAQQSGDTLLDQAHAEIEQIRAQAYQEGLANANAEAAGSMALIEQIVAEVGAWREKVIASSEQEVIGIIRQMAGVLFGSGAVLDENALQTNLSRIMEQTKSLGNLRIYLNPVDANRLDATWRETQSLMLGTTIKVILSDTIKPGGCFIDGESGSVDGRVETQLEAVLGVFDQPNDDREETH